MTGALFEPLADGVVRAGDAARGPWTAAALHGGPVAALLARSAEAAADAGAPEGAAFLPTRLTVELLRPVPPAELRVTGRLTRPGRKVQLAEADVCAPDGTLLATARLVRIAAVPVDAPVTTRLEPPPAPGLVAESATTFDAGYEAFHSHGVEHRFAAGSFNVLGPATDWIRLRMPVVAGETPSPLQRVAAAADFGNGISRVVEFGTLRFINPDLSIHLHRLPVGEWVCLEAVTWMEDNGTALAESRLWDEQGPIGRALQGLVVDGG